MSVRVEAVMSRKDLARIEAESMGRAIRRAAGKAGSTGLRDMRSEASKRIRQRKRLKAAIIAKAFVLKRPKGGDVRDAEWSLRVSGDPVPLIAYPHRQTRPLKGPRGRARKRQYGVLVQVNPGRRTLVAGAFIATMRSGHEGIFQRMGAERLPIRELLGSRPVDALLHAGEPEAILARGRASFASAFERLLPIELEKIQRGGGR